MPDYPFEMNLVVDPGNPSNIVPGAEITIYGPTDTGGVTPLVLKTPSGVPLANPIVSNANGFTPPFIATESQVRWAGGGYTGYWSSYQGLLTKAQAAQAAAEAAAETARTGAGVPVGGADGQLLGHAAGKPMWVNAPAGGTVSSAEVKTIVADSIESGTGEVVGALDGRYKRVGAVPVADLPAGSTVTVRKTGTTWPVRPTSRSDITVIWVGADPDPTIIASGTSGAINGVDIRMVTS